MIDIIVPIYNEGYQVIKLLKLFEKKIKNNFSVYLCYDSVSDNIFNYITELNKFKFKIVLLKNIESGPCCAVKTGLLNSQANCKIVYPADDFINLDLLDLMYKVYLDHNADIVVASRFVKGGSMVGCPFIKSILVRIASSTLYFFSSIPVKDASNGFRLFSKKLLEKVKIESKLGFAYSLELLVKCNRLNMKILEVPAQWEERSVGESKFKIFKWLNEYIKWYVYGLQTFWLKKRSPINIKNN